MSISWSPKHQTTRVSSNLLLPSSLHPSFSRSGYFLEYPPFLCVTSICNPRSHRPSVPHCHHALPPSFLPLHPGCSADRPVCVTLRPQTSVCSHSPPASHYLFCCGLSWYTPPPLWRYGLGNSQGPMVAFGGTVVHGTHPPGPPTSPIHPTSFSTPGQSPFLVHAHRFCSSLCKQLISSWSL